MALTQEQLLQRQAGIERYNKELGYDQVTGKPLQNNSTYNLGDLNNTTPVKVPPTTPPTFGGLSGALEAGTNSDIKNEDLFNTEALKKSSDKASADVLRGILDAGNTSAGVDYAEQDMARKEANKYSQQIQSEQLALRRQQENILKNNPTGALRGGQADLLANIERDSLSKQADIAILKAGATQDYETAKSIADRQVALNTEQAKMKLEAYKFIADTAKGEYKTALEQKIKKADAELKKQEETEKAIADMKVNVAQSDAPNKQDMLTNLGKAKTLDEALKIAGKYGGDYLKTQLLKEQIKTEQAQRENIYANIAKTKSELGAGKPATQAQYTAGGFASRVVQAKDIIDANQNNLSKLGTVEYLAQRNLPNALQSPLIQKQLQAERNFVNAVLRRESGAAISPEEFKSAEKQYFPMAGDSTEVLAQKKANRDLTSANLINESGSAYQAPITEIPNNRFSMALGKGNTPILGTKYVSSVNTDGSVNFTLPTNPKTK